MYISVSIPKFWILVLISIPDRTKIYVSKFHVEQGPWFKSRGRKNIFDEFFAGREKYQFLSKAQQFLLQNFLLKLYFKILPQLL